MSSDARSPRRDALLPRLRTLGRRLAPRHDRQAALAVFLIALAVRWLHLLAAAGSPTFRLPIIDAETYDALARSALATGRLDVAFFWQPFFYPAFLTTVYALTGGSIVAAKLLQGVLGACTCVLVMHLARRLVPARGALLAGLIAAAYGPLVFYDGELLATSWAAFWAVALVLVALDARAAPRPRNHLTLGLVAGLAMVTRPPFIPVAAAIAAWLLWPRARTAVTRAVCRAWFARAACLAAGVALITLPVCELSRRATHAFTILPYSGGLNLYIGNNPGIDTTLRVRPGWEWDTLTLVPARYGIPPGRETSRFFAQQVKKYIALHPVDYLAGLARKSLMLVTPRELPRNTDMYLFREWSWPLRVLLWKLGPWGFPFGLLLPLAAIGVWSLGWRRVPVPAAALVLLYAASVILVFPTARYRTPLLPVLIPFAAAGALQLADWFRNRRRMALLAGGAALAASAALSLPGPFPQEDNNYRSELYYCLSGQESRRGNLAAAERHLERALAAEPGNPDALNSMGVVLERTGRHAEAELHYRRAMAANPRNLTARTNLANILYSTGSYAQAERQYRRAAEIAPRNAQVRRQLAMCLIRQDRMADAVTPLYEALTLEPNDAATHNNLGSALNQAGRTAEAIEHFQAAILLDPDLAIAVDNLGSMLEGQQRLADAAVLYRAALERAGARGQSDRVEHYRELVDAVHARQAKAAAP